jgi:succinate-semialdehyde dehydrogenase/glutarate-semialdehyde dehydrogenase
MAIATINPATGRLEEEFTPHSALKIEHRLQRAEIAVTELRETTVEQRAEWMMATAQLLDGELETASQMLTAEMGKPIAQARQEVLKCARCMRFYAEHTKDFLAGEHLEQPARVNASAAWTRYEPLGIVLAVMPWNYPLWQVVRFAAPALMAGNVGLLKHASNVPQAALYLDQLFARGGFPTAAFQCLLVGSDAVDGLIADPRVKAVTLTGSEPAGRAVAATAGRQIKKVVLELGGSDPFIVLPSADLNLAATAAVSARINNNGQSCIAGKRFIVHTDVYESFAAMFVEKMSALSVGDPTDERNDIGPLATESGRQELADLVDDALSHGARALTGATMPDTPGWFYPPTVLADVTPAARLYQEEAFGPVAALYRVADAEEAISVANATSFGLSSSVWTRDDDEATVLTARLGAGAVFVNGITVSYPELPFGGIKASGVGRELAAVGMREFCNLKTIWKA